MGSMGEDEDTMRLKQPPAHPQPAGRPGGSAAAGARAGCRAR